jgi:hypothetical protein
VAEEQDDNGNQADNDSNRNEPGDDEEGNSTEPNTPPAATNRSDTHLESSGVAGRMEGGATKRLIQEKSCSGMQPKPKVARSKKTVQTANAEADVIAAIREYSATTKSIADAQQTKTLDDHEIYAQSLVPVFRRLSDRQMAIFKAKVASLLVDIEFGVDVSGGSYNMNAGGWGTAPATAGRQQECAPGPSSFHQPMPWQLGAMRMHTNSPYSTQLIGPTMTSLDQSSSISFSGLSAMLHGGQAAMSSATAGQSSNMSFSALLHDGVSATVRSATPEIDDV